MPSYDVKFVSARPYAYMSVSVLKVRDAGPICLSVCLHASTFACRGRKNRADDRRFFTIFAERHRLPRILVDRVYVIRIPFIHSASSYIHIHTRAATQVDTARLLWPLLLLQSYEH